MTSAPRPRTPLDVVIIDDLPALRMVFERLLAHRVDIAADGFGDGPTALDALTSRAEQNRPLDLVITDIRHPGANGIEIIHALRNPADQGRYASGLRPSTVPVLVCTGFDCPGTIARTTGPVVLLRTPFRRQELFAGVAALFRQVALTLECELACAPFVLNDDPVLDLASFQGTRAQLHDLVTRYRAFADAVQQPADSPAPAPQPTAPIDPLTLLV